MSRRRTGWITVMLTGKVKFMGFVLLLLRGRGVESWFLFGVTVMVEGLVVIELGR